jgi:hypothetical protein
MLDRIRFVSTLCLTSSLALLSSVLVAPIRTSGVVSSRPDCLFRNCAVPPGQPTACLVAAMAADAVLEADALASESEEPDPAEALVEPRVSFLIPCSFRKDSDRQFITPRSIHSLYPLRC